MDLTEHAGDEGRRSSQEEHALAIFNAALCHFYWMRTANELLLLCRIDHHCRAVNSGHMLVTLRGSSTDDL